jgi:hypothetical protein
MECGPKRWKVLRTLWTLRRGQRTHLRRSKSHDPAEDNVWARSLTACFKNPNRGRSLKIYSMFLIFVQFYRLGYLRANFKHANFKRLERRTQFFFSVFPGKSRSTQRATSMIYENFMTLLDV